LKYYNDIVSSNSQAFDTEKFELWQQTRIPFSVIDGGGDKLTQEYLNLGH
jgi:hypothetical protein